MCYLQIQWYLRPLLSCCSCRSEIGALLEASVFVRALHCIPRLDRVHLVPEWGTSAARRVRYGYELKATSYATSSLFGSSGYDSGWTFC